MLSLFTSAKGGCPTKSQIVPHMMCGAGDLGMENFGVGLLDAALFSHM